MKSGGNIEKTAHTGLLKEVPAPRTDHAQCHPVVHAVRKVPKVVYAGRATGVAANPPTRKHTAYTGRSARKNRTTKPY